MAHISSKSRYHTCYYWLKLYIDLNISIQCQLLKVLSPQPSRLSSSSEAHQLLHVIRLLISAYPMSGSRFIQTYRLLLKQGLHSRLCTLFLVARLLFCFELSRKQKSHSVSPRRSAASHITGTALRREH